MDIAAFVMKNGLETLLIILLPLMVIPMVLGLIISVFQAATQVQEQLLSFLPKLIVIIIILYFGFTPGMNLLGSYFQDVIEVIPEYVRDM
ncbi:MAG: flagellar biosynthetic protein FliQ [Romboutsia sp.]|nr:flagellar biosynthetic protein FliQ [Romboutsia sp.]